MAPDATTEPAPRPKRVVTRANAVQIATLKKAFEISDVSSSEQLKALSEEISLPEKWIHQWFGRQRVKKRKSKTKATTLASDSAPSSSTSSSDPVSAGIPATGSSSGPILSAPEILRVKLENHDPTSASLSDPLPPPLPLPILDLSSPGAPSGFEYVATSVSTTSSALLDLDRPPPTLAPTRKKRGRAPKNQSQKQNQNQNQNEVQVQPARAVRTRRAKGRSRIPVIESLKASIIKMELVEPSTEVISGPLPTESMNALTLGSNLLPAGRTAPKPSANSTPLDTGSTFAPSHYTCNQPLPMVTPAKRSLLATATTRLGNLRHSRPSLSSNQSDSIYSPSFPTYSAAVRGSGVQQQNDNVQHNAAAPTLASRSRRPALPLYRQGPVFPTRFQNNGPYNYSPENTSNAAFGSVHNTSLFLPPASDDGSMSSALDTVPSMAQGTFPNFYIPRPLAPAFDWENQFPSQMSLNSSFSGYDFSNVDSLYPHQNPFQFHQPQNQQSDYLSESAGYQQSLELIAPPQIGGAPLSAQLEQCDSFNEFLQGTPLDPSIAPLKHLTDILGNFKDGHGTYLPLMVEEERGKLVKCLLDEGLVERNPFQAAMGLSLLTKLGVEWEM